jgi:multidrug efflux pump subunit AcrB
MWIVRLALARPRTTAVLALLILLLGVLSIFRMPTDIFPAINLPVVSVIWSYGGLAPQEMEQRVIRRSEGGLTTTVGDIEHIESQSLPGIGIIKVYFQPGASVPQALAQITASNQSVIRSMPAGITPPLVLQYDAADVPIVQLALSSATLPMNELNDAASQVVRNQLVTVQGASISPPFGGVPRLVMVDLDPQALTARGVTAQDVASGIAEQNLILPAGTAKMGAREYFVRLNNSTPSVEALNDLPIKQVNGTTVYVRDVAHVRYGKGIQTSMVRVNGTPSVLITVYKSGNASTIEVVDRVKALLPQIRAALPEEVTMNLLLDQSVFVKEAVNGVIHEAVIAACLTGIMILLFLGSWRSTLIVAISIPLSILCSLMVLGMMGQTINTLTLGGFALAVGMLVDDATVEVENTTRNLTEGMPLREAILLSAEQVAQPALTSTLAICIVFVPVAFLSGVPQSLFLPLALAVVFAMLPSYLLSRTLVTTMMDHLLPAELDRYQPAPEGRNAHATRPPRNLLERVNHWVEARFETLRDRYRDLLVWALDHRLVTGGVLLGFFAVSACFVPLIGEDFFPAIDAGQMRLHVRAPSGTRLEETARLYQQIEGAIQNTIPEKERELILDNIGLAGSLNFAFSNSGTIGSADGEIDISLAAGHRSTWSYMRDLRRKLSTAYPDCTFYFQPADISTQVLNFGSSAPVDIQVAGPYKNQGKNYALAQQIRQKVAGVQGVVDCYLYQVTDAPELRVNVDRVRAQQMGLTQQNVAGNILVSLSSSSLTSPTYFLDPSNGNQYTVSVQTPQYKVPSVDALLSTPVAGVTQLQGQNRPQLLANVATLGRDTTPAVVSHYNIDPVYDVYASVENRDLGGATRDIQRVLDKLKKDVPRGSRINVVGQVSTMNSSFRQLGFGLIFAIVLVYLLLTVNFESWVDPVVILAATPGALAGVVWMLYVTQTTFNVPSLMGTIMCIGVATANSILLVTFANEQREEGKDAFEAAIAAGYTRLRPVVMTALAMILGMLPMALGIGHGGEQNAPLGRAVIGGLGIATFTTLISVPLVYTLLRRRQPEPAASASPARANVPQTEGR